MKRLYIILIALMLTASYAAAQVTTERCFHLDKVQFLQHKQDFWRSHNCIQLSARPYSDISQEAIITSLKLQYGFGLETDRCAFFRSLCWHYNRQRMAFWQWPCYWVAVWDIISIMKVMAVPLYGDVRYFMGKQKSQVLCDGLPADSYEL